MEQFLILAGVMGVLVLCVVALDKRQKRQAEQSLTKTARTGGSAPPAVGDPLCSTARLIRIITDHNHPAWHNCKKVAIYSREEASSLA
jgi:hypothetical protein